MRSDGRGGRQGISWTRQPSFELWQVGVMQVPPAVCYRRTGRLTCLEAALQTCKCRPCVFLSGSGRVMSRCRLRAAVSERGPAALLGRNRSSSTCGARAVTPKDPKVPPSLKNFFTCMDGCSPQPIREEQVLCDFHRQPCGWWRCSCRTLRADCYGVPPPLRAHQPHHGQALQHHPLAGCKTAGLVGFVLATSR